MFKDEIEKIVDRGLHVIASTVADGLFASKMKEAREKVAQAEIQVRHAEAACDTTWSCCEEDEYIVEMAHHRLEVAREAENLVAEARGECYWEVYVGDGPYR